MTIQIIRAPRLCSPEIRAKAPGQLTPAEMRMLCADFESEFNYWALGYPQFARAILISLLMPGRVRHAYALGMPGLAKSHMMETTSHLVSGLVFKRIQCDSDLMPSTITGGEVFDLETRKYKIRPGDIIGKNLVMADEIPRATPNAQGGFLQAMAEGGVSLPNSPKIMLPDPFVVLATANPAEQKGVYPLPEAQLDRFLFQLIVGYIEEEYEKAMLLRPDLVDGSCYEKMEAQMTREQLIAIRDYIRDNVFVSEAFVDYLYEIVNCTRPGQKYHEKLLREHGNDLLVPGAPERGTVADIMKMVMRGADWGGGAGPRSAQCLLMAAKIFAFLWGKDEHGKLRQGDLHVEPSDLDELLNPVLRHRLILAPEAKFPGFQADPVTANQVVDVIKHNVQYMQDRRVYQKKS